MNLLHVDSSIQGEASASRLLTRQIVARYRQEHPQVEVAYRDLAAGALHHLSPQVLTQGDATEAARGAEALEQFLAAEVIVIGAPIYNFSIPSQLKAWIDRIAVAGRTFRYTAEGPEGLARGKKVIVALTRGGVHTPGTAGEFGESYLRFLFGFLGVEDVSFVRAQGLAISAQQRAASIEAALGAIDNPVPLAA
jgi:FMN-dependent NADH-azoreductase